MARHHDYVFVLWADQFEEAPAAIFVTKLREAGLRVKVVGATPAPIFGSHGLALTPDLTLDQAFTLLAQVICLIIPQTGQGLFALKNDPRLSQLFESVCKNQVKVVLGTLKGIDLAELGLFPPARDNSFMFYPEDESVVFFARELSYLLRTA